MVTAAQIAAYQPAVNEYVQVATVTSDIVNLDLTSLKNRITALRNALIADKTIRAADIIELMSIYNEWISHKHSVTDVGWLVFGDVSMYANYNDVRYSDPVKNAANADTSLIGANVNISTAKMKGFIQLINAAKSHKHDILDNPAFHVFALATSKLGNAVGFDEQGHTFNVQTKTYESGTFPADYNSTIHGKPIWPLNSSASGKGWVGNKFIPNTNTATLKFVADQKFECYINGVLVMTSVAKVVGGGVTIEGEGGSTTYNLYYYPWNTKTVSVNPGVENTIELYVVGDGNDYGVAGTITVDGSVILKTATDWQSYSL